MGKLIMITVATLLPVSIGGGSILLWLVIEHGRGVVSSRVEIIGMLVWCAAILVWFRLTATRWAKYWRSQRFRASDPR